jgi:hypothetical protein
VGGSGYGLFIGGSSQQCWFKNCKTENIRENPVSWNVRHSGFEDCEDRGSYDDGFNSHGTGNDHIHIIRCTSISSRGQGFAVGSSSHVMGDTNIYFEDCKAISPWFNGFFIASPSTGLKNHKNVNFSRCRVYNVGLNGTTNSYPFTATYADGLNIDDCEIDGANNAKALQGIFLTGTNKVKIRRTDLKNIPSYGIVVASGTVIDDLLIQGCTFDNIASYNIRNLGTVTKFRVIGNVGDDDNNSFTADVRKGNVFGTTVDA